MRKSLINEHIKLKIIPVTDNSVFRLQAMPIPQNVVNESEFWYD